MVKHFSQKCEAQNTDVQYPYGQSNPAIIPVLTLKVETEALKRKLAELAISGFKEEILT